MFKFSFRERFTNQRYFVGISTTQSIFKAVAIQEINFIIISFLQTPWGGGDAAIIEVSSEVLRGVALELVIKFYCRFSPTGMGLAEVASPHAEI